VKLSAVRTNEGRLFQTVGAEYLGYRGIIQREECWEEYFAVAQHYLTRSPRDATTQTASDAVLTKLMQLDGA